MVDRNGQQKGIKTILMERGLWQEGMVLKEAKRILSDEVDFIQQEHTPWIKEIVTKNNHIFKWFPKFHPEFNFIERYCTRIFVNL